MFPQYIMRTKFYNIHIDHTTDESGSKHINIRPSCIQKDVFKGSVCPATT